MYRLYALPDGIRPGLVRTNEVGSGNAIELEVWDIPVAAMGTFIESIKPPLGLGQVLLQDGSSVLGFLCEGHAVEDGQGATDITKFAGWRAYRSSLMSR